MDYITTAEASALWGYSEATIRKWCREGLIFSVNKAEKKDNRWRIPANADCPKPKK